MDATLLASPHGPVALSIEGGKIVIEQIKGDGSLSRIEFEPDDVDGLVDCLQNFSISGSDGS